MGSCEKGTGRNILGDWQFECLGISIIRPARLKNGLVHSLRRITPRLSDQQGGYEVAASQ